MLDVVLAAVVVVGADAVVGDVDAEAVVESVVAESAEGSADSELTSLLQPAAMLAKAIAMAVSLLRFSMG